MDKQTRIAVLIDAENISKKYVKLIFDELSEFGIPTYKRIYGSLECGSFSSWKDEIRQYALTPIANINYTSGKNASDSSLIIDAMDILYSGNVDGFCIVTSDSDFTKLAIRLREAGKLVIGMGEQKTPGSLASACETFKYLDLLLNEVSLSADSECAKDIDMVQQTIECKEEKNDEMITSLDEVEEMSDDGEPLSENSRALSKEEIGKEIKTIIESKSDEWVNQAEIGKLLGQRMPGFDYRYFGYNKLSELISQYDFLEIDEEQNPNNSKLKVIYVKIK